MEGFKPYRSHKVVQAAQINTVWHYVEEGPDDPLTVSIVDGDDVHLDPKVFARYTPVVGDYLVRYEDGYLSISPKAAFEGGYSLIEEV